MRQAKIIYKEEEAGSLTQSDDGSFVFRYHDVWINDREKPPISLTFPKNQAEYRSEFLFPFFYSILPEGANKQLVCHAFRIDKKDHFGILLNTAAYDTIGAVKVIKMDII